MDTERNKKIMLLAMKDSARGGRIVLPVIMLFEVIMLVLWDISNKFTIDAENRWFLFAYTALLLVSLAMYLFVSMAWRKLEKHYKGLRIAQDAYALFFLLWGVFVTYIEAHYHDHFSIIIFMTILVSLPVFSYLHPFFWSGLSLVSSAGMVFLAVHYLTNLKAFIVDFCIFVVTTVLAHFVLFRVRENSYRRQIEAEEMAVENFELAHTDTLTGLANRLSYQERVSPFEKDSKTIPENLVIASFDINGLKYVNDNFGHMEGDALIAGASKILKDIYGKYGQLYRMGGDEFTGLLQMSREELNATIELLQKAGEEWKGRHDEHMDISAGFCVKEDAPDLDFLQLTIKAEEDMYSHKTRYYERRDMLRDHTYAKQPEEK